MDLHMMKGHCILGINPNLTVWKNVVVKPSELGGFPSWQNFLLSPF
jgi:hypothetical protein